MNTWDEQARLEEAERDLIERIGDEVLGPPPGSAAPPSETDMAVWWTCDKLKAEPCEGGYQRGDAPPFRIYWLGFAGGGPRKAGHLLVDPNDPNEHAAYYVCVRGSRSDGYELVGWCAHESLVQRDPRDFGMGPRWHVPTAVLRPFPGE